MVINDIMTKIKDNTFLLRKNEEFYSIYRDKINDPNLNNNSTILDLAEVLNLNEYIDIELWSYNKIYKISNEILILLEK